MSQLSRRRHCVAMRPLDRLIRVKMEREIKANTTTTALSLNGRVWRSNSRKRPNQIIS